MAYVANDWWYTDPQGRRIGWLFPEDFVAILTSFYDANSATSWVLAFSQQYGFSRAQVDRWAKGIAPIPKYVAGLVALMGTMKTRKISVELIQADWLPEVVGAGAKLGVIVKPTQKKTKLTAEEKKAKVLLSAGGILDPRIEDV